MQTRDEQIQALRDSIAKAERHLLASADLIVAIDQQANTDPDAPLPAELDAGKMRFILRACLAYTAVRLRFRSITGEWP